MCYEISFFRGSLDLASADAFNEAATKFRQDTEIAFEETFPLLEKDIFKSSVTWLSLVGTGVDASRQRAVPNEVESWLNERIVGFFRSLWRSRQRLQIPGKKPGYFLISIP